MTNNDIKTFSELLTQDKKTTAELADLIEKIGVYYLDGPGRWQLANKNNNGLERALDCLTQYRSITELGTIDEADEYWKSPEQPIDNFGFKYDGVALYTEHNGKKNVSKKDGIHDKRAIAFHFWLKSDNQLGTRVETWHLLSAIDPKLFPPKEDKTKEDRHNIKQHIDLINTSYEERYGEEISFKKDVP